MSKLGLTEREFSSGLEHAETRVSHISTKSYYSEDGGVVVNEKGKENMRAASAVGSIKTQEGSVWLEQGRRGRNDLPGGGIPFAGYDPQGLSHARFRAPSTVASERSWGAAASTGSSFRSPQTGFTKSGFAKIKVNLPQLTWRMNTENKIRGAESLVQATRSQVFLMMSRPSAKVNIGQW